MTDWPALLARLEARGIDAQQACHVVRSTVWKWRYGGVVPATEHAVTLVLLDVRTVDGHTAKIVEDVSPEKQV